MSAQPSRRQALQLRAFRTLSAARANPVMLTLVGAGLIVLGVAELVAGDGHGRLVAVGALVFGSGAAAFFRSLRTRRRGGSHPAAQAAEKRRPSV